jgi:hypothetical protein
LDASCRLAHSIPTAIGRGQSTSKTIGSSLIGGYGVFSNVVDDDI